jgi:hypothetical protein
LISSCTASSAQGFIELGDAMRERYGRQIAPDGRGFLALDPAVRTNAATVSGVAGNGQTSAWLAEGQEHAQSQRQAFWVLGG